MKRKYIIIISIISLVLLATITFGKIGLDFYKETKIKEEIKEIMKYINNSNYTDQKLTEILERSVVKKGDYNEVETSIKNYYKDLANDLSNLQFLLSEDNFVNYLSADNLKEDQPNFIKSKAKLVNSASQIEEVYQNINTRTTDINTKRYYIADKQVKTYYKDFYLSLIEDNITEEFTKKIKAEKNNGVEKTKTYNQVLDFLIANEGHWNLNQDIIVFDETTLYEEYLNITKSLKEDSAS